MKARAAEEEYESEYESEEDEQEEYDDDMIMAMKMSAEAAGEPFVDPRTQKKPKQQTLKPPAQEFNAMALNTKGFEQFLKMSE